MNELLFVSLILLAFAAVLFASRWGHHGLVAAAIFFTLTANVYFVKITEVFGLVASIAAPLYAGIFVATKVVAERFGPREAYRTALLGYLGLVVMVLAGFIVTSAKPAVDIETSQALDRVFRFVPRIVLGAFAAYALSQPLNVMLFSLIGKLTHGKHLWLRNVVSTTIAQGIDTVVFVGIGFYGRMDSIWEFVLVYWLLKVLIAALDTPVVYYALKIIEAKEGRPVPPGEEV
jgi:uncharacterized integral membrane protein (TIGR00697 family)